MVRIITDSSADFEPHEYAQMQVSCIPLYVSFGEAEYQENVNLSKDQFYRLLEEHEDFPRTSQPSPLTLEKILKEARDSGDDAVVIPLSSALSGTCQSITMMKDALGYDNCHIVDSLSGTGGIRMQVEYAVKLRDEGKSAAEIAEAVQAMQGRIVLYACMDTLEYLMKGGRISRSTYAVGTLVNIKPILQVTKDGRVEIPAKVIGMRKGIAHLGKIFQENEPDPDFPVYAMYTKDRTNGELMARHLERFGCEIPPERIINVGAAIGSHVGPNACGMVYVAKKK